MFWTIIIILFILWILGYRFNVGGNFIHTLLVIVLIVLIVRFLF